MNRLAVIPIFAALICGCSCSKLNPTTEAFGWKLGDILPDSAEVRTNIDSGGLFYDAGHQNIDGLGSCNVELMLNSDRKIYSIRTYVMRIEGTRAEKDCSNALIQALTDKYGVRDHLTFSDNSGEIYYFGTKERSAMLIIDVYKDHYSLDLDYSDRALRDKVEEEEKQRKAAAQESLKENMKKQGL